MGPQGPAGAGLSVSATALLTLTNSGMKWFKLSRSSDNKSPEVLSATKKCPECLADIPKEAKKCSRCGSKQKRHLSKKEVILVCAVIFLPILFLSISSGGNSNPTASQPEVDGSKAHIIAKNYVQTILKSPSTADFPTFDYQYADLGNNKYQVVSYVDAQNSFGAQIRNNYSVTLSYNGGDWADIGNWTLHELILDGEVVYKR